MALHEFFSTGAAILFAILAGMFGNPNIDALVDGSKTPRPEVFQGQEVNEQNLPSFEELKPLGVDISPALSSSSLPSFPPAPRIRIGNEPNATPVPPFTPVPPRIVITPSETPKPTPPKEVPKPEVPKPTEITHNIEDTIVNILCSAKDRVFRSTSGSGVIIDPDGIILTAAHVAQFSLLRDYPTPNNVQCIIRMGSPARNAYIAVPAYVSENWIKNNASLINQNRARGNGKNDIALLAILGSATNAPLPKSFPYVPLASEGVKAGDSIVIASYGAEFLTSEQLLKSLYQTIVSGEVKKTFTLGTSQVDLLSLGASAAAQSGSSGGTVVKNNRAVGVITTSSLDEDLTQRDLRAVSMTHVRASYLGDRGSSLDSDLKKETSSFISSFEDTAQELAQILIAELEK